MDDFFSGFGNEPTQDSFDLAALQFFEELDRKASKGRVPPPRTQPEDRPAPAPEETPAADLEDGSLDSLTLKLMEETEREFASRSAPAESKSTRPLPRRPVPKPGRKQEDPPLSDLARKAAALFDALPTEDQLLAYTLLQKLARAAEKK